MVGIVSYGAYIPKYRITTEEIAGVWHKDPGDILRSLAVTEKAVAARDEDTVTLALEAARVCVATSLIDPKHIKVVLVGSESHPYAVNPTSTIIGEFLGIGNDYLAADLEFACKAGTAALQLISGLVEAGKVGYGLAMGADTAQSRPHDTLEYSAGAGAACVLLGNKPKEVIAALTHMTSFSSDTPDFWRRDGVRYPSHGGRFTGEPAYFAHVLGAARQLLTQSKTKPADFDYCIFHSPNGKFPRLAAKRLGFTEAQLAPSFMVNEIGNPYSASSLIALSLVLDIAKPKQKIFMISYGSGAGSDGFIFETTAAITSRKTRHVRKMIETKEYINYSEYLKRMKVI